MAATIRLATAEDAGAVAAIYAPFCLTNVVSFEEDAPSPEEMARRIERITEQFPWLVLDDDGVAGYAYASPHRERAAYRWSVDVTVYVHEKHRRRGVGRALYTTLLALLEEQGYHKAFGGVALPNPASESLHEALGFEVVGVYRGVGYKHGAWRDVRWYSRTLRPQDGPPRPTVPISAVVNTPAWDAAVSAGVAVLRACS